MAQITSVTSEALQARIRELLPSQQGFGEDLQASNVILPTIDLTSAAEGSSVPSFLQRAWDFSTGHTTTAAATNTLINNTGFWQLDLNLTHVFSGGTATAELKIDDGTSEKIIWEINFNAATGSGDLATQNEQFIVFLRAGDSLEARTNDSNTVLDVVYRQVADVNGVLTNPLGFTPQ